MASRGVKPLIHIIDDDDAVRDSLDAYLTLKGMKVLTFGSAREALLSINERPDIVILDVNMPDIDGFMLFETLRNQGETMPVVLITGLGDNEMRLRAQRLGVSAFFDKPIDPLHLLGTLNRLLA